MQVSLALQYIRKEEKVSHTNNTNQTGGPATGLVRVIRVLMDLCPDFIQHGKVDEEVTALPQCGRHRFVESGHLDTHSMIGAIVKHGHKIAISADQDDAVDGTAIYESHDIHT